MASYTVTITIRNIRTGAITTSTVTVNDAKNLADARNKAYAMVGVDGKAFSAVKTVCELN